MKARQSHSVGGSKERADVVEAAHVMKESFRGKIHWSKTATTGPSSREPNSRCTSHDTVRSASARLASTISKRQPIFRWRMFRHGAHHVKISAFSGSTLR